MITLLSYKSSVCLLCRNSGVLLLSHFKIKQQQITSKNPRRKKKPARRNNIKFRCGPSIPVASTLLGIKRLSISDLNQAYFGIDCSKITFSLKIISERLHHPKIEVI